MKGITVATVSLLGFLGACTASNNDPKVSTSTDDLKGQNILALVQAELGHPPSDKWTPADEAILAPYITGNDDKGSMLVPQWRGAGAGIEEYVFAPPSHNCSNLKGTVRVDWDAGANTVHIVAKYKGLTPHPSVHRTEGVDYFPNQFHAFPKDFDDGTYRLWLILTSTTRLVNMYYDPVTLNLLGDEFRFPNGPPNNGAVITIRVPGFAITGSNSFDPDKNGFGFLDYTIPYSDLQVQNHAFSIAYNNYAPFNLCQGVAAAPARGQLRPVVSPWLPTGQGITWKQALIASVGFDLQLERRGDDTQQGNLPYIHGGVAYMGNGPGVQGGTPPGYRPAIPSMIQNVAPVIAPIPNYGACQPYLNDPHINAPNFCGP